ncbi:hypothetical protein [Caballeronia sordidicola]|uniref:Uncharacterized protein n=1 Tax=Caballeronia sordidicola TaxID=196367 RepID=A0A226WQD1_CABSO|nr:hypothetical protein [Caballeronia sordidicola]OXC73401.1 hypothetical protein BSU04_37025 [Caballeronia sordidicola]
MSTESGTVTYVKVSNATVDLNFCLFGLLGNSGQAENIYLWVETDEVDTAAQWILRNAQLALLRDAFVNKLLIVATIDDTTSVVTSIQLGTLA